MKRLLMSILACTLAFVMMTGSAQAQPGILSWLPVFGNGSAADNEWISQLESDILPQLDTIFTPAQREQFETAIGNGMTFRKAFKSLVLTPEQKTQLKTLLKSVSKKDAFAALTPDQKAQLFLKKKEMFMPTAEEIGEKINASIKAKGGLVPEGIQDKIDASIKRKELFIPSPEEITAKIKAGITAAEEALSPED